MSRSAIAHQILGSLAACSGLRGIIAAFGMAFHLRDIWSAIGLVVSTVALALKDQWIELAGWSTLITPPTVRYDLAPHAGGKPAQ